MTTTTTKQAIPKGTRARTQQTEKKTKNERHFFLPRRSQWKYSRFHNAPNTYNAQITWIGCCSAALSVWRFLGSFFFLLFAPSFVAVVWLEPTVLQSRSLSHVLPLLPLSSFSIPPRPRTQRNRQTGGGPIPFDSIRFDSIRSTRPVERSAVQCSAVQCSRLVSRWSSSAPVGAQRGSECSDSSATRDE